MATGERGHGVSGPDGDAPPRLVAHLRAWLGRWPPAEPMTVVGYPGRLLPGWDGAVRDAVGVAGPAGAVLSVPPERADAVRAAVRRWEDLPRQVPRALGRPDVPGFVAAFRWSTAPADLPDAGVWVPASDPRLPEWLRPFGGEVLVALEGAMYAAGVGLKRHDAYGTELSVGTEPEYRGRGLAARLVAQAARRVLDDGRVPTYLHDLSNVASARTATRAGFPDLGWQAFGMPPAGR